MVCVYDKWLFGNRNGMFMFWEVCSGVRDGSAWSDRYVRSD